MRLLRLLKIVPVKTGLLIQAWPIIEKYHVYEAALREGINSTYLGWMHQEA